jgi:hypothetical protein
MLPLSCSILSHFFRTVGSQVGGLEDPHIHPYPRIRSPTDCCVILYLVDLVIAFSRVGGVKLSYPMFHDIHFASKSFTIYILTPRLPELPSLIPPTMSLSDRRTILYLANFTPLLSQVRGFTKVSNHISLPSILATLMLFPMHIYYSLNANNSPYRFERIVINKRKARGDLILKHIKTGFTEDYIIPL